MRTTDGGAGGVDREMAPWDLVVRELITVERLTRARFNEALRPLGLTMTHVDVLTHLSGRPGGALVNEIVDVVAVNQPAVSKMLHLLVELGAVRVETPNTDARCRLVRLTDLGAELLSRARVAMRPEAESALGHLGGGDVDRLVSLLAEVRVQLERTEAANRSSCEARPRATRRASGSHRTG